MMAEDNSERPKPRGRIGQRHVQALLIHLGLGVLFSTRVSLSVALVAMVTNNRTGPWQPSPGNGDAINRSNEHPLPGSSFQWSRQTQGLILSAFFWGYLLLQVPAGGLAQRHSPKRLLAAGIAWTAFLTALTPWAAAAGPYVLSALLALKGVGAGVVFPAALALLGRWAPSDEAATLSALALSGAYTGTLAGQASAGPLAGATNALGGWPLVFFANAGAGFLWLGPWFLFGADTPSDDANDPSAAQRAVGQREANRAGVPWRRLLTSRAIGVYAALSFAMGWLSYSQLACLPQFLADRLHLSLEDNGLAASLPVATELVGISLLPGLSDVLVRRRSGAKELVRKAFTVIGFGGCGVALLGLTFLGREAPAAAVVCLLGVGSALLAAVYGGFQAVPLDVCPEFAGTVYAIGNICGTLAGIAAPLVIDSMTSGATQDRAAAWNAVYRLSAGVALAAALLHALLGSSQRRYWHHRPPGDGPEERRRSGRIQEDVEQAEERQPLLG